jgi:hypothetical protein
VKLYINISILIVCVLFGTCGINKQNNFNKQKFTNLKAVAASDVSKLEIQPTVVNPLPPDSLLAKGCDTLWLKSGKILECTILSDDGKEIKFTDCPPSEIVSTIAKSSTKLSPADSAWQANHPVQCDTIFLKGGEKMLGQVQYETKRKLVYKGCCKECTVQKTVMMKTVDSVRYVKGKPKGPNVQVPTTEKEEVPTVHYSETEKAEFTKKKKLYKILAFIAVGLAIASITIFMAIPTAHVAFGALFFALMVVAIGFAIGFTKNKNKLKGKE